MVADGIKGMCERRKRQGTSASLDFLVFHRVAVHGFAAGSGAAVVCGVCVQASCPVI